MLKWASSANMYWISVFVALLKRSPEKTLQIENESFR